MPGVSGDSSLPCAMGTWVGRGQLSLHGVYNRYSIIPRSVRCSTKDYGVSDVSAADQVWGQKILPVTGLCSALAALKPLPATPVTSVILEVVHRVPDEPQSTTYFASRTQSTFVPASPFLLTTNIFPTWTPSFPTMEGTQCRGVGGRSPDLQNLTSCL